MDIRGKKVAILVHNYFEQAEFEEPLRALKDAGAEVTVITAAENKQLQALQHVDKGDTFTADLLLKDATPEDYDALVVPGGAINADHLRIIEEAQGWVHDFLDTNRPLAVICHAPWLLVSADVLDGKQLTSYHTIQDDINNAGGEWLDQEVVVDGRLITSRKPDDLPAFNDTLITMLAQAEDMAPGTFPSRATEQDQEAEVRLHSLGYDEQRDQLTRADRRDILADDDETDPDQLHLSRAVPGDERDSTK